MSDSAPILEAFAPYFRQYALLTEFKRLSTQFISGVYCVPSTKNSDVWDGVILVRKGPFANGIFKFYIEFPATYPNGSDVPRVFFLRKIFHPHVDAATNELDVKRKFPIWRKNEDHVWDILQYLKKCFYRIEVDSPLNAEAAYLYQSDPATFQARASSCVSESNMHLLSNDESEIQFQEWRSAYESFEKDAKLLLQTVLPFSGDNGGSGGKSSSQSGSGSSVLII